MTAQPIMAEEITARQAPTCSTYTIISKVAYLIGVEKRIFEHAYEPPRMDCFTALEKEKNARIIRNLCMLRTALERNYAAVSAALHYDAKSLRSLPELIPQDSLRQLEEDGIQIVRSNGRVNQYLMDINRHISNRVNNCRELFPAWLCWDYVRSLFIMPNGLTETGLRAAAAEYYACRSAYPYHVYLNWPLADRGNILYNDQKFLTLLYEANEDRFQDFSKVTDAGSQTKDGIYRFLEESRRAAIVVDCENSDPYKLYAMLRSLDEEALLSRITKIILYNDVHTTSAWRILERFTCIPIEHNLIERIKDNKSLVDIRLTTGTCREYFLNNTDSFLLLSSDSDYWGMISAMPEARFMVMVEREKCGPGIKRALECSRITYCYMDDFCTADCGDIKTGTLLAELRRTLSEAVQLNLRELLHTACQSTRVDMTAAESRQFFEKYLRTLRLTVDEAGAVSLTLCR